MYRSLCITYSCYLCRYPRLPAAVGAREHGAPRRVLSGGVQHWVGSPAEASCGHAGRTHSRSQRCAASLEVVGVCKHRCLNSYMTHTHTHCTLVVQLEDPTLLEIAEVLEVQDSEHKYTVMLLRWNNTYSPHPMLIFPSVCVSNFQR